MKGRLPYALGMLLLLGAARAESQGISIREASGITRADAALLIVSDEEPGVYYRLSLPESHGPVVPVDPGRVARIELPRARLALDLEAIDVLADGRVVVLSERLRALVAETGIVAEYDNELSELGNRGLEGLSVRSLEAGSSRVAVLWEGGYPEYRDVPDQLQPYVGRLPMRPVVWVHDVRAHESNLSVTRKRVLQVIELDVPRPAGVEPDAQRFRAPDLVWHRGANGEWGFIVLLSSQNSPKEAKPEYRHRWLQRFSAAGKPIGPPLDLDSVAPAHLKGANWEGLGWFEEGRSLVLIHDQPPKGQPTAVIVEIPGDWRTADPRRAGFSHLLRRNTPYYLDGPQQARPPEGTLPAGTRARVVREAGSHSLVETDGGIAAYVSSDALLAGSPGLIVVESPWHALRAGAIRVTAVYADGPAWLVVHRDDNGRLGDRSGHARLEKGWNAGVTVQLEPGPTAPTKVWAVYYPDRQTIGAFEPGPGPGARGACEGPDRPDVICRHHLEFLPDACLKPARAFECSDGLPIGTSLFTAVP